MVGYHINPFTLFYFQSKIYDSLFFHLKYCSAAKDVPYQDIIATMGDQSFRGFNIMYAFHEDESESVSTLDLGFEVKVVHLTRHTTKFDIHLTMRWTLEGGIEGNIIYSTVKFGQSTMQRFADEFVYMLTAIVDSDLAKVHILELPMICPEDLVMIRDTWNESKPYPPFPPPKSVAVTLFDAMNDHSRRVALQEAASGRTYTYLQLLNQSMTVAAGIQMLSKFNKTKQFCVGLIFDRGISMYATMLAVLFCGGILVPIDASHTPVDRTIFLLQDSGADIVIHDEANTIFVSKLREQENEMPDLLSYNDIISTEKRCELHDMVVVTHDSPFCIMYTSGTTGNPKGVVIMVSNIL
jgi:non-ribosomal peptide synthetase component F